MLRKVGVLVGLLVFAGGLWGADPQEKKSSKKSKAVAAKVVSVDAANGMLTVKTKDGEKELKVGDQTKFTDAQGKEVSAGIKDKQLAAGTEVRIMLDEDGKTVKELRLAPKTRTAQGPGRATRVRPFPPKDTGTHEPQKPAVTAPRKPLPPVGTVVKVNRSKKEIVLQMVDSKGGKGEQRTIEVTDGVKLLGAEGDDADVGGFRVGDAVFLQEKDGKVTQLQIFKLGAERRKVKK
jgi:hypothetical protein